MAIVIYAAANEDQALTFRTYRSYLEATRLAISQLCPHASGFLEGVAGAVSGGPWRSQLPTGRILTARASEFMRNAWGTEVLLNAPRVLGAADLITYANHWAVVQAYYAVFAGLNALFLVRGERPPTTHGAMLRFLGGAAGKPSSPFVAPWTFRVSGHPGAYVYGGFPTPPNPEINPIANASSASPRDLLAKALKTTRDRQIDDRRPKWLIQLTAPARARRQRLTRAEIQRLAGQMPPTTLFDLLYRLRIRSNYQEADAFLSGALSSYDASAFHEALTDVVAGTLLTIEMCIAHQVGSHQLEAAAAALTVPRGLEGASVMNRFRLW